MHRTQILIPPDLHRRAAEAARARRTSFGGLVRDALAEYLSRGGESSPTSAAVENMLLAEPFDDPTPDPMVSLDVDHYLYGARRRSRRQS